MPDTVSEYNGKWGTGRWLTFLSTRNCRVDIDKHLLQSNFGLGATADREKAGDIGTKSLWVSIWCRWFRQGWCRRTGAWAAGIHWGKESLNVGLANVGCFVSDVEERRYAVDVDRRVCSPELPLAIGTDAVEITQGNGAERRSLVVAVGIVEGDDLVVVKIRDVDLQDSFE